MKSNRLPKILTLTVFLTGLSTAGATTYRAFDLAFPNGPGSGQPFRGRIVYDEKALTGTGREFLYTTDDFFDDSWSKQPSDHEGLWGFNVTVADIPFNLWDTDSEDWIEKPYLSFNDGSLDRLRYFGLIEAETGYSPEPISILDVSLSRVWFMTWEGDFEKGTITLISDNDGPASPLANQLGLYDTGWLSIKNRAAFTTPYADFVRVDDFDHSLLRPNDNARILLESIFGDSETQTRFGLADEAGGFQSLLTNLDLLEGVTIDGSVIETSDLVFATDQGDSPPSIVPLSDTLQLQTWISTGDNPRHVLWMLDDFLDGDDSTYRDFNDFILLATIKAVPEPAAAVLFFSVVLILAAVRRRACRNTEPRPH